MSYNRHFGYKYSHFGEDTKGHDLKGFGDTTGKYVLWDASADTFYVVGVLDLTGNVQLDGTFTVGVDDTGYDVTFFGATAGKKFFWDESADTAFLTCTVDIDGTVTVGVDDTGYDVKFFGDTTAKYMLWDTSGDELILTDGVSLNFGTGLDVDIAWDGASLNILPATDDTGAINFGNGTKDMDVKFFVSDAAKFVLFDVGNVLVQFDDVDLKLGDNDILQFGDAAGGDVNIKWNATNLLILPAVDDTGAIYFGDGTTDMDVRLHLGTTTDYVEFDVGAKALELVGDARIDLSGATVAAGNTDGGVIKAGTSSAKVIDDTADMKFMSFYWDNGAASGDARGIYNRLYLTGAGGGGEAFRNFTTVEDVAGATAHGMHNSLSFGASGSVTGLGVAGRNTLHIPDAVMAAGGTYSAVQAEIWSDGATSDAGAVTELSFLRLVNGGNASGIADVDDDAYLIVLDGGAIASGNVVESSTSEVNYAYSIRCKINGTVMYLMAASAVG